MKKFLLFVIAVVLPSVLVAQVGIGTDTPNQNSILDLTSTSKGFLPPRVADHTTITGADGMMVYDLGSKSYWFYKAGTGWTELTGGTGSTFWTRDAGNAYIYPTTTTDKLVLGTFASPPEKLNIDGNIWFSKNLAGTARKISVQGQAGAGGNGTDLQVSAGASSGLGTAGALYLDGGTHDGSPGGLSLATIARGTVSIRETGTLNSKINLSGSIGTSTYVVPPSTTTLTLTDEHHNIVAEPATTLTITLPGAPSSAGREYTIKLGVTGTIVINPTSGQTIDGEASITMSSKWTSISLISDGSNWVSTTRELKEDPILWGRNTAGTANTYLLYSNDVLCLGTSSTNGKLNIEGNLYFPRVVGSTTPRTIYVGNAGSGTQNAGLWIHAGGTGGVGAVGDLMLDGGNGSPSHGKVLLASQNSGKVGIRTSAPVNSIDLAGSVGFTTNYIRPDETDYTLADDYSIFAEPATTLTVSFPSASLTNGRIYTVKLGASGTIVLDPLSSETIDGQTTMTLSEPYKTVTVQSDGSEWKCIAKSTSDYWLRSSSPTPYVSLATSSDKLSVGTTNTTEKFNLDGNIYFTRGTPFTPRKITVEGQSNTSSDGCQLRISAGGGSPQSNAADLFLDGGRDTYNNADGQVNINSISSHGKIGLRTSTATSSITMNGSVGYTVSTATAVTYDAKDDDNIIICTTGTNINLPSAVGKNGRTYTFKRTFNISLDLLVLDPYGTQTIDGATTLTIPSQWDYVTIISNGSNWLIISKSF